MAQGSQIFDHIESHISSRFLRLVGGQQLRSADRVDPNQLDLLQSPHLSGDRLIRMTGALGEFVDGPGASRVDQDEREQLPLDR